MREGGDRQALEESGAGKIRRLVGVEELRVSYRSRAHSNAFCKESGVDGARRRRSRTGQVAESTIGSRYDPHPRRPCTRRIGGRQDSVAEMRMTRCSSNMGRAASDRIFTNSRGCVANLRLAPASAPLRGDGARAWCGVSWEGSASRTRQGGRCARPARGARARRCER